MQPSNYHSSPDFDFQTYLKRYAKLIATHGLNVQVGQDVNISTETCHRDLVHLLVEACYEKGARWVGVDYLDPWVTLKRVTFSKPEDLDYVPQYVTVKYDDMVRTNAANLKLIGSEDPELLSQLPTNLVNKLRKANFQAVKSFYEEGIGKSLVHWTVAAAATPLWASKVFPDLSPSVALNNLWLAIFRACRVTEEDYLELWKNHNDALHSRAKRLNELQINTLQFRGPKTDLKVGLSQLARWKGGTDLSPRGVPFEPNLPTEEVFTTPDYRMTEGVVKATRPILVNGTMVSDLEMEFKNGILVNYSASSGADTFGEYIDSDPGGRRLGEVALVGIDSPIYQSGIVFREILFDENAACHIAVGSAYKFCLAGGEQLTSQELEDVGCNESSVHTDMMISSQDVNVIAILADGTSVELIKKGAWVL